LNNNKQKDKNFGNCINDFFNYASNPQDYDKKDNLILYYEKYKDIVKKLIDIDLQLYNKDYKTFEDDFNNDDKGKPTNKLLWELYIMNRGTDKSKTIILQILLFNMYNTVYTILNLMPTYLRFQIEDFAIEQFKKDNPSITAEELEKKIKEIGSLKQRSADLYQRFYNRQSVDEIENRNFSIFGPRTIDNAAKQDSTQRLLISLAIVIAIVCIVVFFSGIYIFGFVWALILSFYNPNINYIEDKVDRMYARFQYAKWSMVNVFIYFIYNRKIYIRQEMLRNNDMIDD